VTCFELGSLTALSSSSVCKAVVKKAVPYLFIDIHPFSLCNFNLFRHSELGNPGYSRFPTFHLSPLFPNLSIQCGLPRIAFPQSIGSFQPSEFLPTLCLSQVLYPLESIHFRHITPLSSAINVPDFSCVWRLQKPHLKSCSCLASPAHGFLSARSPRKSESGNCSSLQLGFCSLASTIAQSARLVLIASHSISPHRKKAQHLAETSPLRGQRS